MTATPRLRGYHVLINEATGRTDVAELDAIENCMRDDIFHSTLDWQSRELLIDAARAAERILIEIREIAPSVVMVAKSGQQSLAR